MILQNRIQNVQLFQEFRTVQQLRRARIHADALRPATSRETSEQPLGQTSYNFCNRSKKRHIHKP